MVGELELAYMLVISAIFAVPGMMKLVEVFDEAAMVGRGHIKVLLLKLNRRLITHFVKPKNREFTINKTTYSYNDHPDYMVYSSGFFIATPTIAIDEKSHDQIKLCHTTTGDGISPTLVHGTGKIAYNQGYIDGQGDTKKMLSYLMIVMLLAIGGIALGIIQLSGVVAK